MLYSSASGRAQGHIGPAIASAQAATRHDLPGLRARGPSQWRRCPTVNCSRSFGADRPGTG